MAAFLPIRTTRASTEVIAQIRSAILSRQYLPGDRLPTEREMARQFGVSRVTIRDALRALEAAGLLEIRVGGHGGPYVAAPNSAALTESLSNHFQLQGTSFHELAEARLALETTAARLAAERATAEDLGAMRDALEEVADSASRSVDFHTALVSSAHNKALLLMWSATRALLEEAFDTLHARQPDMVEVARQVHRRLYEAIEKRDGELAVRLMREHLYDFAARAEKAAAQGGAGDPDSPGRRPRGGIPPSEQGRSKVKPLSAAKRGMRGT